MRRRLAFVGLFLAVACSEEVVLAPTGQQADGSASGDTTGGLADGVLADAAASDAGTATSCPSDQCLIDGQCFVQGTPRPGNPCQRCVVLASPATWTAADDATCDDGNACTSGDACDGGQCVGKGLDCDDGNTCTDDSCAATGCVHLANTATCEDGSACSVGDACKDSGCQAGGARTCSDGNPCTTDSCDPKSGCLFQDVTATCDDGNACTVSDTCTGGGCQPGAAASCDDGNVCTTDGCDKIKGCVHKDLANLCKDDNPCTDEACDPKQGCVFPFNQTPCDDKSLCTIGDTCTLGACVGQAVPLDDGVTCTDDSCDPKAGVVHTPNTLPCNDNDACTLEDTCGGGVCQKGAKPLTCVDGVLCTDDSCAPATGCVYTNNTLACDDDSACTKNDVCANGTCAGTTISCDDGNACTSDSCDAKTGCKNKLIVSNACRPIITVDYPPRAATLQQASPTVVVKGKVVSGAGPITSFKLNGGDVPVLANGTFSVPVSSKVGGNALVFEAQDSFGSKKRRVQSYLYSTTFYKPEKAKPEAGLIDPGLAFWLSQQVTDDGDHKLPANDLATIFELYLQSLDLSSLLPNPLGTFAGVAVTSGKLAYDPAKVTLKSGPGSTLLMTATIVNVKAPLTAKGSILGFGWTSNGNLTVDNIAITATLQLSVDKATHKLVVTTTSSTAALNGVKIANFSGPAGFLINLLGPVIVGAVKPSLEGQISNALKTQIGPALANALGALALNASFDISKLDGSGNKIKLTLQTDFSEVSGDTPGLAFLERARVVADKTIPYDNLGVPGRVGCGKGAQVVVVPKAKPLELVIADDSFNELLYGTWLGGLFEFPVPATLLGNVDLGQYGVSDLTMKVSAMLAPTMDDCNAKSELTVQVGDFRVDAKLKLFGQPMDVVVYATFTSGMVVKAQGDQIGIQLTELKSSALQVDVLQDNLVGSESVLEKLVGDALLNNLVAQLGGNALGSFPLPAIDLSAALPTLPPGTSIAIAPETVTRASGNSVVGGKLK